MKKTKAFRVLALILLFISIGISMSACCLTGVPYSGGYRHYGGYYERHHHHGGYYGGRYERRDRW